MFNQNEIAAALIRQAHDDPAKAHQGAVMVVRLIGPAFYVDATSDKDPWNDDKMPQLVEVVVDGVKYNVIPIPQPIATMQVALGHDVDTCTFQLVIPDDPNRNVRGSLLIAEYKRRGKLMRQVVPFDMIPTSTLKNLVARLMKTAPDKYRESFDKLANDAIRIKEAYCDMFV